MDNFGVNYCKREDTQHLIESLLAKYDKVTEDWDGKLYCGITLDWNYREGWFDILMPKYIAALRIRYKNDNPKKPQDSPYKPLPREYGSKMQKSLPADETPKVDKEKIKAVQRVIGGVLYYGRAVDITVLPALSSIASEQAQATKNTEKKVERLLDYLATHSTASIRYYASDMILNIQSDASYLSETRARSRVAGNFFLGSIPKKGKPIELNGAIHILCGILKLVVASATEAELGPLFLNCKEGKIQRLILQ